MSSAQATSTSEVPARRRYAGDALDVRTLAWIGLALLCLAAIVGFVVYPTYPNYDSIYSLLWGREAIHGDLPSLEAYRAPTQHPLWVAVGGLISLIGVDGDRVLLAITLLSFVLLVVGVYKLAAAVFTPLAGLVAGLLVSVRLDFPFLAIRGYVDVPYLALIAWAAALEARTPRRGAPVWLLLTAAGLLRPEAWLFAGLYVLRLGWRASWGKRIRYCLYAAVAPLVWLASDLIVTGDALYSLHYTTRAAELLGRQHDVSQLPGDLYHFLVRILRTGGLAAGIAGLVIAARLARDRILVPSMLLFAGLGTYAILVLFGFTAIPRYLFVSALALLVFAAFALTGFDFLPRTARTRRPWAIASVVAAALAVILTAATLHVDYIHRDLTIRGDAHRGLASILARPAVRDARRCGPVSVPTYKLIPDTRWLLSANEQGVIARTDPAQAARLQRGVALVVNNRSLMLNAAYGPLADFTSGSGKHDPPLASLPPPGYDRIAYNRYFAAYARCG